MVNHIHSYFTDSMDNMKISLSTTIGYIDTIFLLVCIILFVVYNAVFWSNVEQDKK